MALSKCFIDHILFWKINGVPILFGARKQIIVFDVAIYAIATYKWIMAIEALTYSNQSLAVAIEA